MKRRELTHNHGIDGNHNMPKYTLNYHDHHYLPNAENIVITDIHLSIFTVKVQLKLLIFQNNFSADRILL